MDTQKLRQRILDLAIRGKLVPQDPNDEPASVLLDRIRAEKERLIAEGKIKRPKTKKSAAKSRYQKFTPPFDIPASWQWVKLGEFLDLQAGKNISACEISEKVDDKHCYPCFGGNGVRGFVKSFNRNGVFPIIGRQGALCGNINIASGQFYATEHAVVVDYPDRMDFQYLVSLLSAMNLNQYATATAQPGLAVKVINELYIPIPPFNEQKRIGERLIELDDIIKDIESQKLSLAEATKVSKSKILELAVTGKLVPQDPADEPAADMLRRINPKAKIITDNPHYPQLPDNWVLTTVESVCDYGYSENVSVDNIESSDWVLELEDIEKDSGRIITQKVKQERVINGVRHRFVKNNVLYSKLRTYLNKVLVAPANGYCTTEIIPIKSYDCVIPEYLCLWLRSPVFLSYTAECCYGVKMPRLSTSDARKGIIPLPPIQEQKRVVQKLNEISTSLEIISNSLG